MTQDSYAEVEIDGVNVVTITADQLREPTTVLNVIENVVEDSENAVEAVEISQRAQVAVLDRVERVSPVPDLVTIAHYRGAPVDLHSDPEHKPNAAEWSAVAIDEMSKITGPRLVAYLLKLDTTDDLDTFNLNSLEIDDRKRLCTARWLAVQVSAKFDALTTQSWLVARNPMLGFDTPLGALRNAKTFKEVAPQLANAVAHLFA